MDDTTRRPNAGSPEPPAAGDTDVTGVAKGSLGTGTALDDTDVWEIPPELQAATPPEPQVAAEPARVAAPPTQAPDSALQARPAPAPMVDRQSAAPAYQAPAPMPMPVRTVDRPAVATGSNRTAGIVAALLVVLIAGAAVIGASGTFGDVGPSEPPPAADQVTPAPTVPADTDGEGGNGKGNGKGNGNGNGKGNGND